MLKRAVHPGEILKDELEERGVSPASFARQIDVPANRISQILAGKRAVTGDSALRFGHWFVMDPQFWLNLAGAVRAGAGRAVGWGENTRPAHRGWRRVERARGGIISTWPDLRNNQQKHAWRRS